MKPQPINQLRMSESPASRIARVEHLWQRPQAVPRAVLFPEQKTTLALERTAQYSISAFRTTGQLLESRISLASPERRALRVDLYPSTNLPLFMTNANLLLMFSEPVFFTIDYYYIQLNSDSYLTQSALGGQASHPVCRPPIPSGLPPSHPIWSAALPFAQQDLPPLRSYPSPNFAILMIFIFWIIGIIQMGGEKSKQESLTLRVATLNYSGILKSPYQFYAKGDEFKITLGTIFKSLVEADIQRQLQQGGNGKSEEDTREKWWTFQKLDVNWQEKRFTPVYERDCGVKEKIYLMNKEEFETQWDSRVEMTTLIKKYPPKTDLTEPLKRMRKFDLLTYEAILIYLYVQPSEEEDSNGQMVRERSQENILSFRNRFSSPSFRQSSKPYRELQSKMFSASYLNEEKKVAKTIEIIKQQDIVFVQEANELLVRMVEKSLKDFRIVKKVDDGTLELGEQTSVIFIRDLPQLGIRSLVEENLIFFNNYKKLNLKKTEEARLSREQIDSFNLNSETVVQAIGNLFLICPHLSSKPEKNIPQLRELAQLLKNIKKWFPHSNIIVGGDLNGNFLSENPTFTQGGHFFVQPQKTVTCSKCRTHLQVQRKKADDPSLDIKDYLISTLQIEEPKVLNIQSGNRKQVITDSIRAKGQPKPTIKEAMQNSILLPTDDHPYDHFLVSGKVKLPLPLLKVYSPEYKQMFAPSELSYKEILILKDLEDKRKESEKKAMNETEKQQENKSIPMLEEEMIEEHEQSNNALKPSDNEKVLPHSS